MMKKMGGKSPKATSTGLVMFVMISIIRPETHIDLGLHICSKLSFLKIPVCYILTLLYFSEKGHQPQRKSARKKHVFGRMVAQRKKQLLWITVAQMVKMMGT
jgi:hypothetical protein